MTSWMSPSRPYSIAHRGASAYAADCSLEAYEKAARLGADMWEVDIRSAACGALITYHDASFPDGQKLSTLTASEIAEQAKIQNVPTVPFERVLELAVEKGAGIYADIKDTAATVPTMKALQAHGIEHAILGAFDPKAAQLLDEVECPYPRSVLVPLGAEPFEYAKGADVIHLCWEHMDRPQDELTPEFLAEAERRGQKVVLWHEEDPDRMADLRHLPILGICSDRPELVHPFRASGDWPVEIVCHRGANEFAPENTLSAAHCAFAAGFDYVEIDVHDTADGALVVFHDMDLARTTPGRGAVNWKTHDALTALDAGQRYDSFFANEPIPALGDVVSVARQYGKQLYVELKNADPARALEVIKAHNMLEHCFFWAFDLTRLRTLRQLCPEARIMVRRQDVASLHEAQEWHPDVIEYDLRDDLSEITQCRELGLCTMVAYMGRDPACFDQIADLRPDRVNLHFPFQFRDYLRKDYRSL